MAFLGLWRRKLRSFLTILAIIIGAVLVTLVFSVGDGLERFITDQFQLMVNQNTLTVSTQPLGQFGMGGPPHELETKEVEIPQPFTETDIEQLEALDGVERVDYIVDIRALYVSPENGDKRFTVSVEAVPQYEITLRRLVAGQYLDEAGKGQAIIALDYVDVFGWESAEATIGKQITVAVGKLNPYDERVGEFDFTVVAVNQSTVNTVEILVPLSDGKEMARYYADNPELYTRSQPGMLIQVKVVDGMEIELVAQAVEGLGFYARTPAEILQQISLRFDVIKVALSVFGIIALVVAGIGITNTILMAIHERTREIGIMKAVGATRASIRLLFTAEGASLGLLGGAFGAGLGYVIGLVTNTIASRTFLSDFPTFDLAVYPPWITLAVIALTTFISLVAVFYPANRAAGLDPVQALSYE
jgi:putative ABC transport system permease protein